MSTCCVMACLRSSKTFSSRNSEISSRTREEESILFVSKNPIMMAPDDQSDGCCGRTQKLSQIYPLIIVSILIRCILLISARPGPAPTLRCAPALRCASALRASQLWRLRLCGSYAENKIPADTVRIDDATDASPNGHSAKQ